MQSDTSGTNKIANRWKTHTFNLPIYTYRLCLHTAKDKHQAYIFNKVIMNLIKLFFISVGPHIQPLVFSVIVALSTLCNS